MKRLVCSGTNEELRELVKGKIERWEMREVEFIDKPDESSRQTTRNGSRSVKQDCSMGKHRSLRLE
jgi:hypothetical protein